MTLRIFRGGGLNSSPQVNPQGFPQVNSGKKKYWWVFAIFLVLILVCLILGVVIWRKNVKKDNFGTSFLNLITIYDEVVGEDLSQLYKKNAYGEDLFILSEDEINRVDESLRLVLDSSSSAEKVDTEKYEKALDIVEDIEFNMNILKSWYEVFAPQVKLSREELVATCGSDEKNRNLIETSESNQRLKLESYSANLCIALISKNGENTYELKRAKVDLIRELKPFEGGFGVAEEMLIQTGEKR